MPELEFQVTGAEAVTHGLSPLVHFHLLISAPGRERIQALLLQAQVQLQCPQRTYSAQEEKDLVELFGPRQTGHRFFYGIEEVEPLERTNER